jgi:hypothetical protein
MLGGRTVGRAGIQNVVCETRMNPTTHWPIDQAAKEMLSIGVANV